MSFNGPMSDISDNSHSLLEPSSPAYTNVTVRRAFIVWMYCGQRNKFKDVCNYFHYLELLEDQMPPERRASSRHHEFNLFSNQPPTSNYLINHFPQLYSTKVEGIGNEKSVFKLEGFNETAPKQGTTTHEIVETSQMIRRYCRIQMVTLKKFLEEFQQHARKCDLKHTVNNVALYIKRKMIQAEIELEANYPKTLSFLNSNSFENDFNDMQIATAKDNCKEDKSIKPVKILKKGAAMSDDTTKNYFSIDNYNGKNPVVFTNTEANKNKVNDKDSPALISSDRIDPTMTEDIKTISLHDSTDESVSVKKERRFSGSQFIKIELHKCRKI